MSEGKIADYQIVSAGDAWLLSGKVRDRITQGWVPIGGGFARESRFYQAMVRYLPAAMVRAESKQERT